VANPRGKGRGDLQGKVLRVALDWLRRDLSELRPGALALVELVAGGVLGAFMKMQDYLWQVEPRLCEVDPALANNPGLAAHLLELEEQWDLGDRYLMDPEAFQSLLDTAASLDGFRAQSKPFASMIEECGAELFLVLPRLVWLAALQSRDGGRQVLEKMLPSVSFDTEDGRCAPLQSLFTECSEALFQSLREATDVSDALTGVLV
ncbi:unnamed protein product, partial [Polarella glacialis]